MILGIIISVVIAVAIYLCWCEHDWVPTEDNWIYKCSKCGKETSSNDWNY